MAIHFTNCNDIYKEHNGPDTSFLVSGQDFLYSDIDEKMDLFERYWDFKARAPFLISKLTGTLVSFDDEESVTLKAKYIIDKKARRMTIWPLMGDYLQSRETPLLDKIYESIN